MKTQENLEKNMDRENFIKLVEELLILQITSENPNFTKPEVYNLVKHILGEISDHRAAKYMSSFNVAKPSSISIPDIFTINQDGIDLILKKSRSKEMKLEITEINNKIDFIVTFDEDSDCYYLLFDRSKVEEIIDKKIITSYRKQYLKGPIKTYFEKYIVDQGRKNDDITKTITIKLKDVRSALSQVNSKEECRLEFYSSFIKLVMDLHFVHDLIRMHQYTLVMKAFNIISSKTTLLTGGESNYYDVFNTCPPGTC